MPHEVDLIRLMAAGFGVALLVGFIAVKARLPALVGYLLAGIMIGPFTPGFVADAGLAGQLAEVGVMLLMFGVGLHFSLDDLLSVRRIALPGAIVQILAATVMGGALALSWGWSPGAGIVFGLALSVASTVVLLKALESGGLLESANGRIAVGWLVVEDLVMVLVLVLLPPLAALGTGGNSDYLALAKTLGITLGKVAVFIGLMLAVGRKVFPWLLWQVAKTGSRELFTLAVIAVALSIAYGSAAVFGVSFALGAFFAGMVLRESDLSLRAAEDTLPLRDAFAVLFFVSVGMLFDPRVLVDQPLQVAAVVAVIVLGKSLAAFVLVLLFRYPVNTALTVSASLAQIGEFSFILAGLGVATGLLPPAGLSLILAGALISIAVNPLVFLAITPVQTWLKRRAARAGSVEADDPLAVLPDSVPSSQVTDHVIVVGYGGGGRRIGAALAAAGIRIVVADHDRELVETLRAGGVHAVAGDAALPAVLIQAHVARARALVIAVPDTFNVGRMIEVARALNPSIETVVRAQDDEEAARLRRANTGHVFTGDHELALAMTRHVLERPAKH